MKFGKRDKSIVDALFLLAVFGIFLVCALFIVLFGAKIYKNTVKSSSDSFFERTCSTYITEKIRQNDTSKGVSISSSDGSTVVELTKSVNGSDFTTFIYMDEGYLKEYTSSSKTGFNPLSGTKIIEISSFNVEKCTNKLYRFDIADPDGNVTDFYVSITSSAGNGGGFNE